MPKLTIQGRRAGAIPNSRTASILNAEGLGNVTVQAIQVSASRSAGVETIEIDSSGTPVLVLHLDDGIKIFTSYAQFCEDFPSAQRRSDNADFSIDPNLGLGMPGRGVGEYVLKGLEVFHVDPVKDTLDALAGKVEKQLVETGPGLYRLAVAPRFTLSDKGAKPDPTRPALIFIHGTASSSYGSFSGLARKIEGCPIDFAAEFKKASEGIIYDGNVFAFEHRTLTESPIQNALDLLEALPDNGEFHLVTHSRGGLVGDLLTLGQTDSLDVDALQRSYGDHPDTAQLGTLLALLRTRKPRITRYVRYACPARGTTIASKRADRWFSMLLSLTGKVLDKFANPGLSSLYEAVQDFLVAFAARRLDPTVLPGMAAMMPDSKLVRLLNLSGAHSDADLSVVAGSAEGKDLLSRLKFFTPDQFYGGKHDLVVNCASMDGGVPRGKQWLFSSVGADVHHLNYFETPATRGALLAGLRAKTNAKCGFEETGRSDAFIPRSATAPPAKPVAKPVVILIPGLFGSHLRSNGGRIWLDYLKLANGGLGQLEIGEGSGTIQPDGVVQAYYQKLIDSLTENHEVIPFPYDWRLSMQMEGKRLAVEVERILNETDSKLPVRIVAHSAGGLLARVMLAQQKDLPNGVWKRLRERTGGRALLLGMPTGGSYEVLRILSGQSRLVRQLGLLDVDNGVEHVVKMMSGYAGLLELLPSEFYDPAAWNSLKAADPNILYPLKTALNSASATRKLADTIRFDDRMIYVAGCGFDTPVAMKIADSAIKFIGTDEGDGWAPWETAIPAGVDAYYSEAAHGDLANRKIDALVELLEKGSTTKLMKQPPLDKRGAPSRYELEARVEEVLPNEACIAAAALGSPGPESPVKRPVPKIKVEVVHGDLAFARHPVAVGHYKGDSFVGPEQLLDQHLDGRLTLRNHLGVYPGCSGTFEVFLARKPESHPAGAIVLGLGKVGDLKPKELQETFRSAILKFALATSEKEDSATGTEECQGLSTLLVGTMANVLTIEESLTAMLRAVRDANVALDSAPNQLRFGSVEVLEVYEDLAIRAAIAIERIARTPEFSELLEFKPPIERRGGGLRRSVTDLEDGAWWSRLRIRQEHEQDPLTFTLITNRARSESEDVEEPQRSSALIENAVKSWNYDPGLAQALYELLVPNRLKEYAPQLNRLVLTVDQNSAKYPWELMQDRLERRKIPLAVDMGLIRQLDLKDFRPVVRQSDDRTALVIANPQIQKPKGSHGDGRPWLFSALPSASEEGEAVAAQLRRLAIDVTEEIEAPGSEIRTRLYSGSYRILHMAGHGVSEFKEETHHGNSGNRDKSVNGMVIGYRDFLTPAEIGQLRVVPELVFINCCHSGRTDVMAANLAVEFIKIGVRAVIAAGWTVEDKAAATFAKQFYEYFLNNEPFGDAVRMARRDTYKRHGDTNTWGAYQCYGDPGYKFSQSHGTNFSAAAMGAEATPQMFLPSQLTVELDNLASSVGAQHNGCKERIQARIESLKGATPQSAQWWETGEVQWRLGKLNGTLENCSEAIGNYTASRSAEKGDVTLRGIEHEASMRGRAAARKRARSNAVDAAADEQFRKEIRDALKLIRRLLALGKTAERYSILGGIHKRRAMWEPLAEARANALRAMRDAYKNALDMAQQPETDSSVYPGAFLNWILTRVVQGWFCPCGESGISVDDHQRLDKICEVQSRPADEPTFWNTIAHADGMLVGCLVKNCISDDESVEIVGRYRKAKDDLGSPLEIATVVDHLQFIHRMAELSMLKGNVPEMVAGMMPGVAGDAKIGG